MKDNMHIWNQVCKTDSVFTKNFRRAGGFAGTAIDPTYQIRRATEIWGPIGGRWGYDLIRDEIVEIADGEKLHYAYIMLWYLDDDDKRCEFPQVGQTMILTKGRVIEEAPKMSLTDALTKALSWLGFSADIWLGQHDSKYRPSEQQQPEHKPRSTATTEADDPQARETLAVKVSRTIVEKKIDTNSFLNYYRVDDVTDMSIKQLSHALKTLSNRK